MNGIYLAAAAVGMVAFGGMAQGAGPAKLGLKEKTAVVIKSEKPEKKMGYGGSGGFAPGILLLDLAPVQEVLAKEREFRNKSFDLSDNLFSFVGGLGYGGKRSGARFGGGGWFAHKKYYSQEYEGLLTDSLAIAANNGDSSVDSIIGLDVMLAYGGFIVEKGFELGDFNFHVGGLYGGGALILLKDYQLADNQSAFNTFDHPKKHDDGDSLDLHDDFNVAVAPMMVFDLHAGLTYSFASWVHVGADAHMLVLHSTQSFGYGYDRFWNVSPGGRLRIMFGNLG